MSILRRPRIRNKYTRGFYNATMFICPICYETHKALRTRATVKITYCFKQAKMFHITDHVTKNCNFDNCEYMKMKKLLGPFVFHYED